MRAKGIAYDTGFVQNGRASIDHLDPDSVRRDLRVIRDELHCTAVHLVGGDPARLERAAGIAAALGLEIWFSPYPLDLTLDETLTLFRDCAERAERIRAAGAEVVFVAGVELTLMIRGLVDGDGIQDRVANLFADPQRRMPSARARLDEFLRAAVPQIRSRFHGKVTYAAIPFEGVDWELFDFVTLELIRSAEVAEQFPDAVRDLAAQPKPLAVTGFGCATWRGAADVAPRSMEIVEYDDSLPVRLDGVYERDEPGQARYLAEMLDIFDSAGVDSTFVHLFALHNFPYRPAGDPRDDLDLASLGVVKVLDDGHWEPKAAFAAVAAAYEPSTNSRLC